MRKKEDSIICILLHDMKEMRTINQYFESCVSQSAKIRTVEIE